jgi:methyl-accepting chemotaxis protein
MDNNQINSISPSPTEARLQPLLAGLKALKNGNFNVRLSIDDNDGLSEIAEAFNDLVTSNQNFAIEITRIAEEVGTQGKLDSQAAVTDVEGAWRELTENVNRMVTTLGGQINNIAEIATAIAQGDLSKKITASTQGELEVFKNTVNNMVDRLNLFAFEVSKVAREIGTEGKLGAVAVVENADGIWKELVENINYMSSNITGQFRSIAEVMLAVAKGDLSKQIEADNVGEFKELTTNVNVMISNLQNSIQQITEIAATVASASEEFSIVSKEMTANANQTAEQATSASASAEQVSRNATTVATAVEEMNVSIREISKNAADGAQVATDAVSTAENTNITITKLGQSSIEIGKVIKVITSIAQQTNLLALNATIEAARAGDAGRGFAVVAGEVKELAKETAKATEDISQRIEAIQSDTQGAVNAIAQITTIINQINDIQNTIASAVEEQTATTNEISRNVAEAAKGSTDIAKNIGIVAVNAQNTTTGAGNTSQAAEELSRMAVELQKVVNNFKY